MLFAVKLVGEAETVDVVSDTAPTVKVAVVVLVKAILSVTSVAEMVLASGLVEVIVAVACPLALVAEVG